MTEQVEKIESGVEYHEIGLTKEQIELIGAALEQRMAYLEEDIDIWVNSTCGAPEGMKEALEATEHLFDILPKPVKHAVDETGQRYGVFYSIKKTYYKV